MSDRAVVNEPTIPIIRVTGRRERIVGVATDLDHAASLLHELQDMKPNAKLYIDCSRTVDEARAETRNNPNREDPAR
jgi:hypothetical protein